jgi:hypothetical protein
MAWVIQSDNWEQPFDDRLVLGRAQFPEDLKQSRQHVEITTKNNRVYIRDLESTNGTFLRGQRITPGKKVEMAPGDDLQIGRTHLRIHSDYTEVDGTEQAPAVEWKYPSARRAPKNSPSFLARCVFIMLMLSTLLDPTLAFGRSIGLLNLAALLVIMAVATGVGAFLWSWLLRKPEYSPIRSGAFFTLAFISAIGLYTAFLFAIEERVPFERSMVTAKIRYFCVDRFEQGQCAAQVALCRSCVQRLDRSDRDRAVAKLRSLKPRQPAAQKN